MRIDAKNSEDYISKLTEPRKSEIKKLNTLIHKSAPKLKETMAFGMIGYGPYHYKYASGREGEWVQVALASQKNYISLYVSCTIDGKYLAETYKGKLPKASIGKSCIRFKKLEDVDQKVVEEILKKAQDLYSGTVVT